MCTRGDIISSIACHCDDLINRWIDGGRQPEGDKGGDAGI